MAKYLLIAAIVISLVTAGLGFMNHGKLVDTLATLDQTNTKLVSNQKTLTAAQADLKTTKATLEATSADKEKLATDLTAAQNEVNSVKGQLDAATKASTDKDAQIASLTDEVNKYKGGTQTGTGSTTPVVNVDDLNRQIQELTAALSSANEKIKTDQTALTDYKKQADDRQKKQMQQGLEGRVLAVNPAWNFVVLSIGDKQGVVNNAELLLKRSGQYLGKVRITSVEPSTSIADIVANTLPSGVAVQPGDSVIFQAQE